MFVPFLSCLHSSVLISYLSPNLWLIVTVPLSSASLRGKIHEIYYCILLTSRHFLLLWSKLWFFKAASLAKYRRIFKEMLKKSHFDRRKSKFQFLSMGTKEKQCKRGVFICLKHKPSTFFFSSLLRSGIGETVNKNSSETPTKHEKFHSEQSKPDSYK